MIRDYNFFHRRYQQIEDDFLEILDFIDISDNFDDSCYQIGSSKMTDFCLKVGTEVETLFRQILEDNKFDLLPDISTKRRNQNIDVYREIIEPKYQLSKYILHVNPINKQIIPFENFDSQKPEWFTIYSRYKHNKIQLLKKWNLKYSLYSLGCLMLLMINHPSMDNKDFRRHRVSQKVFDLLNSIPKFCSRPYTSLRYC